MDKKQNIQMHVKCMYMYMFISNKQKNTHTHTARFIRLSPKHIRFDRNTVVNNIILSLIHLFNSLHIKYNWKYV